MPEKQRKRAERDLYLLNLISSIPYFDVNFDSTQATHWALNVIRMPEDDFNQVLMDHKYRPNTGEDAPTYFYTCAFFVPERNTLPDFIMYWEPEVPDDVGNGIALDADPDFSKKYRIVTENEAGVRRLFTKNIIDFLMANERYVFSCSDNCLRILLRKSEWRAFAYKGDRIKPKYLGEYIDTTAELFTALRESLR